MLRIKRIQLIAGALTLGAGLVHPWSKGYGQCETAILKSSDGVNDDRVGSSVAISGSTLVTGARNHSFAKGAAYVFVRGTTGWQQQQQLLPEVPLEDGDNFGASVSIDHNVLVVGTPQPQSLGGGKGRATVFRRSGTTWTEEKVNTLTQLFNGDQFGTSVSIQGDTILVGAPFAESTTNPPQIDAGRVFAIRRDPISMAWGGTGHVSELVATGGGTNHAFGTRVALIGNTAFISAPGDPVDAQLRGVSATGSVYVFELQGATWVQVAKLTPPDIATLTTNTTPRNFGTSIHTDGNVLIIGDSVTKTQRAYIYRLAVTTWTYEATLAHPMQTTAGDLFGGAVAISGDLALVGAQSDDDNSLSNSGTVFPFRRIGGTWTPQTPFYGSAPRASDRLGAALSIDGTYGAAGAIQSGSGVGPGAVYVLAAQPVPDCDANMVQDECQLRIPGSDNNSNGVIDACECQNNTQCNDSLPCTADTCNLTRGECVYTPIPDFCLIDGVCFAENAPNPANACERCVSATNGTDWSNAADNTPCGTDNNECTKGVCQSGQCSLVPEPVGKACGSQVVTTCDKADTCNDAGVCLNNHVPTFPSLTQCDDGLFCTGVNEYCHEGACKFCPGAVATACVATNPSACANDPVFNKCSETLGACVQCLGDADCPADTNACTREFCDAGGFCQNQFESSGTPCGNPTVSDCDLADTCNSSGQCQVNFKTNNATCTSDGNACNGSERCQTGLCVSNNVNPCAGNPATPTCVPSATAPFFTCAACTNSSQCEDNKECTSNACSAGLCVFAPVVAGTPCGSPTQAITNCNLQDTCNGATSALCLENLVANGTSCADADPCNGAETCQVGACTDGPDPCQNGLTCLPVDGAATCQCMADAPCSNGLFCDGVERCVIAPDLTVGTCQPAADTVRCKKPTPVCDETADVCRCGTNADCDDGLFCTGSETCVSGACAATGDPCSGRGLTCNETNDRCDCNDNGDCNQTLFCAPQVCTGGQCVAGPVRCPASQLCDERNDRCAVCLTSGDAVCNDENPCTLDTCPEGQCVHTSIAGCNDSDRDGVPNEDDDCPGTSPGAVVNASGCADFQRDSDRDGVFDDVDQCAGTAAADRNAVDRVGCASSQTDADADGVSDRDDECPESPDAAEVDDAGCADVERDDDEDGVLNGVDRCVESPVDAVVDADGCAAFERDSDLDGVTDDLDQCPATPVQTEVNENGCPVVIPGDGGGDEPGQDVPGDGDGGTDGGSGGAPTVCGTVGMMSWCCLFTGLVALRAVRRRDPSANH